jgi:predicted secreted protein
MKEDIKIEIGQAVDISLESMMGSTGYSWELTALEGCISLTGTEFLTTSTRAIAPVIQVFRLRGKSLGTARAVFSLTAPWKMEKPLKEVTYLFTVTEVQSAPEENLRLEGFVAPAQVTIRTKGEEPSVRPYYGIHAPHDPCGCGCGCECGCSPDDCCSPQPKYGVPIPQYGIQYEVKYGVHPPVPHQVIPVYSVPLDPCLCTPDSDECLCTPPQVMRYNVLPKMRYNVPPMMRYNFPAMRYNFPLR